MTLRHLIKSITTPQQRVKVKRWKRHLISFLKGEKKTSLEELYDALVNGLGLKAGDRIVVASSFGNLSGNYSPEDVVNLLMSIITEDGTIMMPYYPPTNSTIWAKQNMVFDMKETKSGMGILTNVFANMSGVVKSIHPTKAVCVWGKEAMSIAEGHERSTTPFYWDSPYGKILRMGSKSVGLGLKNIPIFHTLEDILSDPISFHYYAEKFRLGVKKEDGSRIDVETYVHNESLMDKCKPAGDYVAKLGAKTYRKVNFGMAFLYSVDNTDLYEMVKSAYANGNTRYNQ